MTRICAASNAEARRVDLHVAGKIRALRRARRKTLLGMARALKCTTEQVRKYERCHNRITAGKLHQIAEFLEVPIEAFYEGLEERRH